MHNYTLAISNLSLVIIICSIIGFVFIMIICLLVYLYYSDKKKIKSCDRKVINQEIIVRYNDNVVDIFDKNKFDSVKRMAIKDFLYLFNSKSRNEITDFMEKYISSSKEDRNSMIKHIETTEISVKKKMKYIFSVLELKSFNEQKKILHFAKYSYPKIPLTEYSNLKKLAFVNSWYNVSENNIINKIKKSGTHGAAIMFKLTPFRIYNKSNIDINCYYKLLEILCKYHTKHRIISKGRDENTLLIYDFSLSRHLSFYTLVCKIKREYSKFIDINKYNDRTTLNIAIVENKFFAKDFYKITKELRQTMNECISESKEFLFYENRNKNDVFIDTSYFSEIESIIKNHSLKYLYAPVLNVTNLSTNFYLSSVKPNSSVFTDIDEIKDYAYKLGKSKDLFLEVVKHLVNKFDNEIEDVQNKELIYKIKSYELEIANSLLNFLPSVKHINLNLELNELDLVRNYNPSTNIYDQMVKIKNKGYKLVLYVTQKNLALPDDFYVLFDAFVYDSEYYKTYSTDLINSLLFIKKSIEKVLKFKKPVIIYGVNTTNDLELRIKEGLKFIAGDAISPFNEMILPVNKKTIEKVKKIKKERNK